jgi:hypothetical protein
MNLMSVKGRCCVDYVGIEGVVTGLGLDDSYDACTSDLRWCIDVRVIMWQARWLQCLVKSCLTLQNPCKGVLCTVVSTLHLNSHPSPWPDVLEFYFHLLASNRSLIRLPLGVNSFPAFASSSIFRSIARSRLLSISLLGVRYAFGSNAQDMGVRVF